MHYTIKVETSYSEKIQRSEFITYLYKVESVEEAKARFARHAEENRNATHNCYGYIIGAKQEYSYYSDQGEPTGTAGKPILNALMKNNLTNVLAVVTRYYGGIKLGVRGLIDAYGGCVETAISRAELIEYHQTAELDFVCEYSALDTVKHQFTALEASISVTEYTDKITGRIIYPIDNQDAITSLISDLTQIRQLRIINSEGEKQ